MDLDLLKKALEAILLASGKVVKIEDLARIFPETSPSLWEGLFETLQKEYESRGIQIQKVAGGYRMATAPEVRDYVRAFLKPKPQRLSRAALETLALIAYYQPLTRAEIEKWRGVDVSGSLRILLDKELIKVVGRKAVPGRPLLYGTTQKFLEVFGLASLEELPPLEELQKLAGQG